MLVVWGLDRPTEVANPSASAPHHRGHRFRSISRKKGKGRNEGKDSNGGIGAGTGKKIEGKTMEKETER